MRDEKLEIGQSWLVALGFLLTGLGGAFAPWIWRDSVALQLTAPGLAEFVKFLPEVRSQQLQVQRLFFLLPLFWAMLAIPLLVENRKLRLPLWLRQALRLVVIPLALASLSPVWTPVILLIPEFRLQTFLALIAIGLAICAPILKGLPFKLLIIFLTGAGIMSLMLPIWQFSLVQAALAEVYREPVALGWGWQLTAGGMVLSLAAGGWRAFLQGQEGIGAKIGRHKLAK